MIEGKRYIIARKSKMDIKKTKTIDLHYSHYITIAIPILGGRDLLDVGVALESSPIELKILYLGDYRPLYLEPGDGSTSHGPMGGGRERDIHSP